MTITNKYGLRFNPLNQVFNLNKITSRLTSTARKKVLIP